MSSLEGANQNDIGQAARGWQAAHGRTTLNTGGNGGNDGGMSERVAKLESDMGYVRRDLSEVRADMRDVRDRLTRVESKIADLPSKTFVFSVYGLVGGLLAAVMVFQTQLQQMLGLVGGGAP